MTSEARRGLLLTLQAMRRQLAAMPHELYLVRLIHNRTCRPFPGERLWSATQLLHPATVSFLRIRNCEGCDVYIHPYTDSQNAGYILLDLDRPATGVIERMRDNGHDPCVVLATSPGHLQAWIHVSTSPLEPSLATAVARQLARDYSGDPASADWRHLGRLAGFTNQKPARRTGSGTLPGSKSCMPSPLWRPTPTRCWSRPGICAGPLAARFPTPSLRRSARPKPARSTTTMCADGESPNGSRSPTGASSISGSPGICCRGAFPRLPSRTLSGWGVPCFPASTAIPTTTSVAPSLMRLFLFPPRGPLCDQSLAVKRRPNPTQYRPHAGGEKERPQLWSSANT